MHVNSLTTPPGEERYRYRLFDSHSEQGRLGEINEETWKENKK